MSRLDDPAAGRRDLALVRYLEDAPAAEVHRSRIGDDPSAQATNVVRLRPGEVQVLDVAGYAPAGPDVHDRAQRLMAELVRMRFGVAAAVRQFQQAITPEAKTALDGALQALRTDIAHAISPGASADGAGGHAWQEFNAFGNSCHHPDCQLTEEQHQPVRPFAVPDPGVDEQVRLAVAERHEE